MPTSVIVFLIKFSLVASTTTIGTAVNSPLSYSKLGATSSGNTLVLSTRTHSLLNNTQHYFRLERLQIHYECMIIAMMHLKNDVSEMPVIMNIRVTHAYI